MVFPAYVPSAVRAHVSELLGVHGEPTPNGVDDCSASAGLLGALKRAKEEVLRLETQLALGINKGSALDPVRRDLLEANTQRDQLTEDVECVKRIAFDPRMQLAYSCLIGALNSESKLSCFVYAAWAARMDYAKYRREVKRASELADSVAAAAGTLARLLRQCEQVGKYVPMEFLNIASLVAKTEHEEGDRNFYAWPRIRSTLLAGYSIGEPVSASATGTHESGSGWDSAPGLARALDALQHEALTCAPAETASIGAALVSRTRHGTMEYLRAFAALLRDVHHIEPAGDLLTAIAITANVVLNDRDIALTGIDVRKVLTRLSR